MTLLEIFKPGRHTAMSGAEISFSESDLKATAEAYDPKLHEAPLVVGHPKIDAPAYGWVKSLAYGDTLQAEPDQVDPAFAELVNAGRFKKISASFFTPDSPHNPKPGVYYLRHVGFLGAQPPAIKGLRQASFADDAEGVVEFADLDDMIAASLFRRLRDWIIGRFGQDEADKVIPGDAVGALEQMAAAPDQPAADEGAAAAPGFSETTTQEDEPMSAKDQERDAAFAERERNLSAREQKIADQEKAARRKETADFVESLVKDGKVLPRDQAGLVAFMAGPNETGVIEFGEGADKQSVAADAWLRQFLNGLPKQVEFGERAAAGENIAVAQFAAPTGFSVDTAQLATHNKALAYQRAHPNTDYVAAVQAVSK